MNQFKLSIYFVFLFTAFCFMVTPSSVQANYRALQGRIEGSADTLLKGDRLNVTLRVYAWDSKLLTQDRKYSFKFANEKPTQKCVMTDDTLKDDGTVRGYCESPDDAGKVEIKVEPQSYDLLTIDGEVYGPAILEKLYPTFNDPATSCIAAVKPSNVTLTKQNDVTVKVDWQHDEKFVGSYKVLYGISPGEYPHSRQTNQKTMMIDGLDPSNTYYFKVQANSICKWVADSGAFKYLPLTGAAAGVADVKASGTSTPRPKASAPVSPRVSAVPATVYSSPNLDATASASPAAEVSQPAPTPSPSPQALPTRVWNAITGFFARIFGR